MIYNRIYANSWLTLQLVGKNQCVIYLLLSITLGEVSFYTG